MELALGTGGLCSQPAWLRDAATALPLARPVHYPLNLSVRIYKVRIAIVPTAFVRVKRVKH